MAVVMPGLPLLSGHCGGVLPWYECSDMGFVMLPLGVKKENFCEFCSP